MGKISQVVNSPKLIAPFKAKYSIPQDIKIRPCEDGEVAKNRGHGWVVVPLIAFAEGGGEVQILMSDLILSFIKHLKLCLD